MYIAINYKDFNKYFLLFGEKTKNTIIENSLFSNILYSTQTFTMNNIVLHFKLGDTHIEKYFSKYKCSFNNNNTIIEKLKEIEFNILLKYNEHKKKHYKLAEQLDKKFFKFFIKNNNYSFKNKEFIIKISGIWETEVNCGIIYKFIKN